MKKLINFFSMSSEIQEYADKHFEGNFSMAVRFLLSKGLEGAKANDE